MRETHVSPQKLAIDRGAPVRTEPLPLEFPGVHHINELEVEAAVRVLRDRSPFRYYGVNCVMKSSSLKTSSPLISESRMQ